MDYLVIALLAVIGLFSITLVSYLALNVALHHNSNGSITPVVCGWLGSIVLAFAAFQFAIPLSWYTFLSPLQLVVCNGLFLVWLFKLT